jgi:hypothetical protein
MPLAQATADGLIAAGATVTASNGRACLNVPTFLLFSQNLTAGQLRLDLQQSVPNDADFFWRGWKWVDTGAGLLMLGRFRLLTGYYLSNVLWPMNLLNLRSVTPELRIAAGGYIGIEAQNTDAVTRKLKIIFFGTKRYYLGS